MSAATVLDRASTLVDRASGLARRASRLRPTDIPAEQRPLAALGGGLVALVLCFLAVFGLPGSTMGTFLVLYVGFALVGGGVVVAVVQAHREQQRARRRAAARRRRPQIDLTAYESRARR